MFATVLLVIHLMVAAALVGVVLLQKSEGGALGMGGGGSGGFLTGRGTANLLTRATAALAAAFFATSISLTILANNNAPAGSAFDTAPANSTPAPAPGVPADGAKPAEGARGGILDKLQPPGQAPADVPLSR
ncbi:MAG: preprotein translocase subunit SecG [Hyphomicrobium sp.]